MLDASILGNARAARYRRARLCQASGCL